MKHTCYNLENEHCRQKAHYGHKRINGDSFHIAPCHTACGAQGLLGKHFPRYLHGIHQITPKTIRHMLTILHVDNQKVDSLAQLQSFHLTGATNRNACADGGSRDGLLQCQARIATTEPM